MLIALTTGLALAAVAGCSGPSNPPASSGATSSASAATSTSAGLAPPITQPKLDVAAFEGKTCSLLTEAQYIELGAEKAGTARAAATGEICAWNTKRNPNTNLNGRFSVNINSKTAGGLNQIYADKSKYKYFEEKPVAGYPSVHINESVPFDSGDCGTAVGINDNVILNVVVLISDKAAPEYKAPCALADKVAEKVIATLKGGS
ncbi:DUF3558 domain-containing protein [Crossiella sp. NPDC003009]